MLVSPHLGVVGAHVDDGAAGDDFVDAEVLDNVLGADLDLLELEVTAAHVQRVVRRVAARARVIPERRAARLLVVRGGVGADGLDDFVTRALDHVLVPHEVADEALVEGLHLAVREEREGVVVLQQARPAAGAEVDELGLLELLVIVDRAALARKLAQALRHVGVVEVRRLPVHAVRREVRRGRGHR